MTKTLLWSLLFLLSITSLTAQKKSELIAEVASLKSQLDSTEALVREARKNEKVSLARAESFETQVLELQDANATLLKNLNSFAEVSNKNSEAINSALASLEDKERQLKTFQTAVSRHDSTAIVVLTNAKQTLGENAKIGVTAGAVVISKDLDSLFGSSDRAKPTAEALTWLGQIASVLKANPETAVSITGLSMTGNLDLAGSQAATLAAVLQKEHGIDPSRIITLGRDGNFKEGINLGIHPNYKAFYQGVREQLKN